MAPPTVCARRLPPAYAPKRTKSAHNGHASKRTVRLSTVVTWRDKADDVLGQQQDWECEYADQAAGPDRGVVGSAPPWDPAGTGRARPPRCGCHAKNTTPTPYPGEIEVAELVAEVLSNPAIARRLYLSRPTVARHVAYILTRLGFSCRAQIAARAKRLRPDRA